MTGAAPEGQPHPVKLTFWAGLLFCLTAQTVLGPIAQIMLFGLDQIFWAANPWNMFGPRPVFGLAPLRQMLARTFDDWLYLLGAPMTCALFWCLAHLGGGGRPGVFVPVALAVPLLFALGAAGEYAGKHDPSARSAFEMISIFIGYPRDWQYLPTAMLLFTRRVLQVAVLMAAESAVEYRIFGYLWLVIGTQAVASAAGFYVRLRGAVTARELLAAMRRDVAASVALPAVIFAWLAGLAERGTVAPGQTVARAIAWPWLIPAVCAAWFFIANRLFNLFPLALAVLPLVVYGIALLFWAVAEELGITSRRAGGALAGFFAAFAALLLCFLIGAQAWMLRFEVGRGAKLAVLTSYLPVYVAAIVSIERGLRIGWRNAGRKLDAAAGPTPPPSAASPRA